MITPRYKSIEVSINPPLQFPREKLQEITTELLGSSNVNLFHWTDAPHTFQHFCPKIANDINIGSPVALDILGRFELYRSIRND